MLALDLVVLVLTVASVAFCLHCIAPKLRFGGPSAASSLIFFGHIAQRASARDYEMEVYQTLSDEQKAMNQISDQVWINSKIVTAKLQTVLRAVRLFSAALLFALFSTLAAKFA